jgi:hypothetical protein
LLVFDTLSREHAWGKKGEREEKKRYYYFTWLRAKKESTFKLAIFHPKFVPQDSRKRNQEKDFPFPTGGKNITRAVIFDSFFNSKKEPIQYMQTQKMVQVVQSNCHHIHPRPPFSHMNIYLDKLLRRRMGSHPLRKRRRIPRLHKYGSGSCKLAHETLARRHVAHDAAARHALKHVLAVPCYKMAVVNDVFLVGSKLKTFAYTCQYDSPGRARGRKKVRGTKLTSFLIIAPKLVHHSTPVPLILYTKKPSPLKMALLMPWLLYSVTMPCVHARKASRPTLHVSLPPSLIMVMSPIEGGAKSSSPGPVYVDLDISPPISAFLRENLILPLSVIVGDIAIIAPVLKQGKLVSERF